MELVDQPPLPRDQPPSPPPPPTGQPPKAAAAVEVVPLPPPQNRSPPSDRGRGRGRGGRPPRLSYAQLTEVNIIFYCILLYIFCYYAIYYLQI